MRSEDDKNVQQYRRRLGDVIDEPLRILPPIQGFEDYPIVSLEESVKKIVALVPKVEEKVSEAKRKCQNPPADGLTVDESASIRLYTMEWEPHDQCLYVVLNSILRSENRNKLKPWFFYMKLLITSLMKIPPAHGLVFRGVKMGLFKQYIQGHKIVWWAFSSSTESKGVLKSEIFFGKEGERTFFKIDCCSGRRIASHSAFPTESEVLILPGTEFQIKSCEDSGEGVHTITLEETDTKIFLPIRRSVDDSASSRPQRPMKSQLPKPQVSPTITPPKHVAIARARDPNYRNRDLERRVGRYQERSPVNLDEQQLTVDDISVHVREAVRDKRCTKLSLRDNNITSEGASALAEAVRDSTTLEELNLGNNRLMDTGVRFLATELSGNDTTSEVEYNCCGFSKMKVVDKAPISKLDLSNNDIGDDGADYLTDVIIYKRTLNELILNDNRIGDRGVRSLAQALTRSESNLKKLDLRNNKLITDTSVNYLSKMLKSNQSLVALRLTNCGLSDYGREELQKAVASKRNFQLHIEKFDSNEL